MAISAGVTAIKLMTSDMTVAHSGWPKPRPSMELAPAGKGTTAPAAIAAAASKSPVSEIGRFMLFDLLVIAVRRSFKYEGLEWKFVFKRGGIQAMNSINGMDLNLLLTLQALLAERHITRAAERLHKSQPAISHALRHLRNIFGDPLLVRRGNHLDLTPRAAALIDPLNEVLNRIGQLFDAPQFDPARSQRTIRLVMSDYGSRVLLPSLVERCRAQASEIELQEQHGSRDAMLTAVQDGMRIWP